MWSFGNALDDGLVCCCNLEYRIKRVKQGAWSAAVFSICFLYPGIFLSFAIGGPGEGIGNMHGRKWICAVTDGNEGKIFMLYMYSTPLYLYFIILKLTGKARCESYWKWVVDCDLAIAFILELE